MPRPIASKDKILAFQTVLLKPLSPFPQKNERPSVYADRMGRWYCAQISTEHQKQHGMYLTPVEVAEFMASLVEGKGTSLRVLDPAAGGGILLCSLIEAFINSDNKLAALDLTAWEVDAKLTPHLETVLAYAQEWALLKGLKVRFVIQTGDFILGNSAALDFHPMLSPYITGEDGFDLVIANPPYFKLSKDDPRAQAAITVVHGQPNIYALFMAVTVKMLKRGGEFVFITPRSFVSGPYFRLFREKFFDILLPQQAHIFGSRKEAFSRDEVLQENMILKGVCQPGWEEDKTIRFMVVTSSQGASDLAMSNHLTLRLQDTLDMNSHDRILCLPTSQLDNNIVRLVDNWTGSLDCYGLKISTGPVVPFRATDYLAEQKQNINLPLLWMNHVHAMSVQWPNKVKKPQYIQPEAANAGLLLPNRNYVLIRRFSSKEQHRRLTAAPCLAKDFDCTQIGLENHLNYLYRPVIGLTEEEALGFSALFNSELLDTYFRATNGNTQVSATEIRAMPLPDIELIRILGRLVLSKPPTPDEIDEWVSQMLTSQTDLLTSERKIAARG